MNNDIPGIFRNLEAVITVAEGYAAEEKVTWVVAQKLTNSGLIYKPCRVYNLKELQDQGFTEVIEQTKVMSSITIYTGDK